MLKKKFLTCSEAAVYSGLSEVHIRRLVRNKKIRGERIGHIWIVSFKSLTDFLESREDKDDTNESDAE